MILVTEVVKAWPCEKRLAALGDIYFPGKFIEFLDLENARQCTKSKV